MTIVTEYLTENADYIDAASHSIIGALTEEQFEMIIEATEEMGGDEPGIDNTLTHTNETLADFDISRMENWNERGLREELDIGEGALKFEQVQQEKCQARCDFIVVDLGEYRLVLK